MQPAPAQVELNGLVMKNKSLGTALTSFALTRRRVVQALRYCRADGVGFLEKAVRKLSAKPDSVSFSNSQPYVA
jgi:hypothetical protein